MKKFEVTVEKTVSYTHVFEVVAPDEYEAGVIAKTLATDHEFDENEAVRADYEVGDVVRRNPDKIYTGITENEEGDLIKFSCMANSYSHAKALADDAFPGSDFKHFISPTQNGNHTVTAFFDVDSDDPEALKPAFAKIVFTREVIDEIARLSAESAGVREVLGAKVSQTAPYNMAKAIRWESQDNIRPEECELVFWHSQFWFSAKPDNGGARFDTYPVCIETIQKLFEQGYNSTAFFAGIDNIDALMENVEESELQ